MQLTNQNEILVYYKSVIGEKLQTGDENLDKFNTRLLFIISSSTNVNNLLFSDQEIETHVFTSKLSEAWFCFETLIPIFVQNGYKTVKPASVIPMPKTVASVSEALTMPKNACDAKPPYGKPDFFDISKVNDGYLEYLLESELDNFIKYIKYILDINENARTSLQKYILHLEKNSFFTQKQYLLESYNKLTDGFDIEPKNILAISYAVRNQYVHDGEVIQSGVEDIKVKAELLKACFNFVINYSLIIATQVVIDRK